MVKVTTAAHSQIMVSQKEQEIAVEFQETTVPTWLQISFAPQLLFDGGEYLLLPGCCYNGNRFDVLKKDYPPLFTPEEAKVEMPVTITDVPRLEKDGSGMVEVTAGDVSVPCIGVFLPHEKKACFLFTVQELDGVNLGLCYQQGKLMLRYPFYREKSAYRWPFLTESRDKGMIFEAGQSVIVPFRYFEIECGSMEEFYRFFFLHRKCMGMDDSRPPILPFEKQLEIQTTKFNCLNWYDAAGFYGPGCKADKPKNPWQPGWCGGGISSYALLKTGGPLEERRALRTLEHVFRTQKECGLFAESTDWQGTEGSCGYGEPGTESWHLVRESADLLFFLFKHFKVMGEKGIEISDSFRAGARKAADGFVALWERYGQLGQFINLKTGEIAVGGSTSGAIAPAALCAAYAFFQEPRYLQAAKDIAQLYYSRDAHNGYTTGGPGEILQCPDSESCAGLLESCVSLYEATREAHWLDKARHLAHLCASWTVAYNYRFPSGSEFSRLGMKSVGAVFANVQNKHAAPGICTLSGDSLYRLWRYTGDPLYQELFEDITLTVSQYLSTDQRPIWSWDVPKDASLLEDDTLRTKRERLLPGYICERVNLSDWESQRCVGGVFNGSCWCESTNLLILADCTELFDQAKLNFSKEEAI